MKTRSYKRIKLAQQVEPLVNDFLAMKFMDLNDDVLFTLFQRLSLNDLCSISLTCTRLHQLAGNYFQRKYPNNNLNIEIFNWSQPNSDIQPKWEFRTMPHEKYAKAFRGFIRNVSIFMYNYATDPIDAFHYLKVNCYGNLRALVLYRIACQSERYGELIKNQLNTLESIKFENCHIYDLYNGFLKYSPTLKQIAIKDGRNQNGCNMDWTKYHYSQLKSFIYHSDNVIITNLEVFLQKNPQITNVITSSTVLFRLLWQKKCQLDFLHLSFKSEYQFNTMSMEIIAYCQSDYLKRLEIQFLNGWEPSRFLIGQVIELAPLAAMQGLHIKHVAKKINFATALEKFTQLKVISIGIDHISKKLLQVLSHLSNLKELHIESSWSTDTICGYTLRQFIRPFAIYAPNIEIISIKGVADTQLVTGNDVAIINDLRKKTTNAKVLTIYLDYELIQMNSFTIPFNSSVQIKPISQLKPDYRKIY